MPVFQMLYIQIEFTAYLPRKSKATFSSFLHPTAVPPQMPPPKKLMKVRAPARAMGDAVTECDLPTLTSFPLHLQKHLSAINCNF